MVQAEHIQWQTHVNGTIKRRRIEKARNQDVETENEKEGESERE